MNTTTWHSAGRAVLVAATMCASVSMAADGDIPPPPWQMAGNNHVLIGVVWNEAVLKLVPKGLKVVPERTGGINIYHSPRGYGAAPYQSGYGWVDLVGDDAADGSKARYIFRAGVGPNDNITRAFQKIWGPAVRSGGTKLESMGGVKQAVGVMEGKVWGTVQVKVAEKCQDAAGILNYHIPDGGRVKRMQIPWAAVFCPGEPVSAEINFPDTEAAGVRPEKLIWAGESREAAFNFTTPVAWK